MITGADLLYGVGQQRSVNGAYYVPLNGLTLAPPTTSLHVDEINHISDQRSFFGQYIQITWKPLPIIEMIAGARMNETSSAWCPNIQMASILPRTLQRLPAGQLYDQPAR